MFNDHYLLKVVREQKSGVPLGIFSVCSANEFVIAAALEFGKREKIPTLIESTSNQVNQFGGYTGMKPAEFKEFVVALAAKIDFPLELLILGGDHLGPNPWRQEAAEEALQKARTLISDYVSAGFTKIHLDASMYLGGDAGNRSQPLDPKIVARRTADLAEVAEEAYQNLRKKTPNAPAPVYVVGSEVPVPGGTQSEEEALSVTKPEDFRATVSLTKNAFLARGLEAAWERVVGVVVQPGVEFGDDSIHEYDRKEAAGLAAALKEYPNLIFEGHSTDYQQPHHLKEMVADGVGILKVGPELTFAFREALFLLENIERELFVGSRRELSNLKSVVEEVMLAEPKDWRPYYKGGEEELRFARKYSLSDRIRYYWPHPKISGALSTLLANLNARELPLPLLSQYFPIQYEKIRAGKLVNNPEALIKDHIGEILAKYHFATKP